MAENETMEIDEEWRPVVGYEGFYEVSNLGAVKRVARTFIDKVGREIFLPEKMMVPHKTLAGYHQTFLCCPAGRRQYFIHRLVAMAFVPGRTEEKNVVNHINEIKTDNRAVNLEWCTNEYNSRYSQKPKLEESKMFWKRPVEAWKDGVLAMKFDSIREAAKACKISDSVICAACRGKRYVASAGGYEWKYSTIIEWIEIQAWKRDKLVKTFYRVSDGVKWANTSSTSVNLCLRGKQKTAGGYSWKKIKVTGDRKPIIEDGGKRKPPTPRKKVEAWKDGKIVHVFKSMSEAARETGLHVGVISKACSGEFPEAGGFIWNLAVQPLFSDRVAFQAWKFGKLVRSFRSVDEAAKWAGVEKATIYVASKGKKTKDGRIKKCAGYTWKRVDQAEINSEPPQNGEGFNSDQTSFEKYGQYGDILWKAEMHNRGEPPMYYLQVDDRGLTEYTVSLDTTDKNTAIEKFRRWVKIHDKAHARRTGRK